MRLGARLQRREGVRIELDPDVRADLVALQAIAGGDTRRAPVEQARVFELGRRALGLVERLEIGTREYLLSTHRSSGASNGPATA